VLLLPRRDIRVDPVAAIAARLSSEQYPASASTCVGVSPDGRAIVVIIGIS
jgi:hypothetical protein